MHSRLSVGRFLLVFIVMSALLTGFGLGWYVVATVIGLLAAMVVACFFRLLR